MAVSPAFSTHVTDLLQGLGACGLRRMFGGAGLFLDDLMFGLIARHDPPPHCLRYPLNFLRFLRTVYAGRVVTFAIVW